MGGKGLFLECGSSKDFFFVNVALVLSRERLSTTGLKTCVYTVPIVTLNCNPFPYAAAADLINLALSPPLSQQPRTQDRHRTSRRYVCVCTVYICTHCMWF